MENLTLKDIADLGATTILAISVYLLWKRLGEITDRLFKYLESAAAERQEIAKANGLTTQDLSRAREEALRALDKKG